MNNAAILLLAIGLDLLLGDPRKLPHITRFTGLCIRFWEYILRKSHLDNIVGGLLLYLLVVLSVITPCFLLFLLLLNYSTIAANALLVLIVFQSIAYRDLVKHVKNVITPLRNNDLPEARRKVGWIVGRDTKDLDEPEICRAAVEALAESANDGLFAPLFWGIVLGPWAALLYRITNTLDSMVGHHDERYEKLGKTSARMDDVLGWIPARLTALLLWLPNPTLKFSAIISDACKHASPNAGWPEATIAHTLDIRLGGTNYYDGERHEGALFNPQGKTPSILSLLKTLHLFASSLAIFSSPLVLYTLLTIQ